jgi:hypothetical protein
MDHHGMNHILRRHINVRLVFPPSEERAHGYLAFEEHSGVMRKESVWESI